MDTQIVGWKKIPYSEQAMVALEQLPKGKTMAVRVKHVKNGKIQIEFAQKIDSADSSVNVLSIFNKSDKRFSQNGPRRTWLTAEKADALKIAGIKLDDSVPYQEILKVMDTYQGLEYNLKITEKLESEYTSEEINSDVLNFKRAGKDGNFFYSKNGQRVVQEIDLVLTQPGVPVAHSYIEGTYEKSSNIVTSLIEDNFEKEGARL